ncbi:TIGR03943 family putative permease subunit [Cohnella yongneupensis]|uniref:TIGR03943 family putative permease subunit n=1 Tax=Cohnella yongneupensis TaxID=425006 RepID=A0ABW0QX03_9BACL
MIRFYIMFGFAFMFMLIRWDGKLNMYINTKYTYLSTIAIAMLLLLSLVEGLRMYMIERANEKKAALAAEAAANGENHAHGHEECNDPTHDHSHDHNHDHHHHHDHDHDHDHGHSHASPVRWKRVVGYMILAFPIFTGIFLPVQTLDSSFVKAKGFSFPGMDDSFSDEKNPGNHQFLKPDSSVFYSKDNYKKVKNKELAEFINLDSLALNDDNYMKAMEVIYNSPGDFMNKKISFTGFTYKGEQVDGEHYFLFRFGFIHCAADSGVFGMLVDFPKGTTLQDDDWIEVTGNLTSELYQPFKQTIPVLHVTSFKKIEQPKDPYVYRTF